MKKAVLKVQLLLAVAITLLFTSCLGDDENSRTSYGEFVSVTNVNGKKVAAFSYGYLDSDALKDLEVGDCAIVDYKIELKNSSSFYTPDFLIINENNIFPKQNQFVVTTSTEYPLPSESITADDLFTGILGVEFSYSYPNQHYDDKWLLKYTYKKSESEEAPEIQIYYNQTEQEAANLEKGIVVLDCVLSRMGGNTGEKNIQESNLAVVDFSKIRKTLENIAVKESDSSDAKKVQFRFRYYVPTSTVTGHELRTDPLTGKYYLLYSIEE